MTVTGLAHAIRDDRPNAWQRARAWLLCERAIALARETAPSITRERVASIRRAEQWLAAADQLFDPLGPPAEPPALAAASSLYRQAAAWTLSAAIDGKSESRPLGELLDAAPEWLRDEDSRTNPEGLRAALTAGAVSSPAHGDASDELAIAELLSVWVRARVEAVRSRLRSVDEVKRTRAVRTVAAGLICLIVAIASIALAASMVASRFRDANLAEHRPFRASSRFFIYRQSGSTPADAEVIFFHTELEDHPWLEVDLGVARQVNEIDVVNRRDCCAERAVPLGVEFSDDRRAWRRVATRDQVFRDWRASVPLQSTRFVRFIVDARSMLHLEFIGLYRRR